MIDDDEERWRKDRNRKIEEIAKLKEQKIEEAKKAEKAAQLDKYQKLQIMINRQKTMFDETEQAFLQQLWTKVSHFA